jgi:glycosyltransferase involved in cell wall biosynthesis
VRLLNVIGSVEIRNGGTTSHVFSISQIWARLGHECHILCLDAPDAPCVAASPIKTIALGSKRSRPTYFGRLPIVRYGYTPALVGWLKANAGHYDAIILNGLWNYTSLGCWRALRKRNVPYYICPHGMLDPWLKRADLPRYILRSAFWRMFEGNVVRDARGVIFACEEEKRLALEGFAHARTRAYVVGYGSEDISAQDVRPRDSITTKKPATKDRRDILFLGRIHKKKGLDLLIRAFARIHDKFPDFDLRIVGPDDMGLVPELKKIASELSVLARIRWAGMLTGSDKVEAYRRADFFVLPSHQENFGIAVVEAMALSIPVLLTNKVNIWREVQSAGAGICATDDTAGLTRGLETMCSLSSGDYVAMADNARRCFIEQFDLDKNARKMLDLIDAQRI